MTSRYRDYRCARPACAGGNARYTGIAKLDGAMHGVRMGHKRDRTDLAIEIAVGLAFGVPFALALVYKGVAQVFGASVLVGLLGLFIWGALTLTRSG